MRRAKGSAAMGVAVGLGLAANRWLDRDRCIAWCGVLLVLDAVGFLIVIACSHGLIWPLPPTLTADFVSFYAAGELADAGAPALAYDGAAHQAAEERVLGSGIGHPVFTYPPVFLLHCAVLARLPYFPAFIAFQAVTLAALVLALRRILDIRGWDAPAWLAMLPVLAFPALWENAVLGQNACLTAALFAWGLLLLPARPWLAGLILGAVCYKPHFGLLLPVALAAGREWRAGVGAALSVAGWAALSLAAFGPATWLAYAAALPAMPSSYQTGHVPFFAMVSPLGAARTLGLSPAASYAAQIVSALAVAAAVGWIWRRHEVPALRAAALLAGTLLLAPLVLFYDLTMAAVATAFLVRHARTVGWLPHEKPLLGAIVTASLFAPLTAAVWAVPIGPLPGVLLLALCLAHARRPERLSELESGDIDAFRDHWDRRSCRLD